MPAAVARAELFVHLAAVPMPRGQKAWPRAGRDPRAATQQALQQALSAVLGTAPGTDGDGGLYADALASALVGAIPSGRWSLKPAGKGGPIVGKL